MAFILFMPNFMDLTDRHPHMRHSQLKLFGRDYPVFRLRCTSRLSSPQFLPRVCVTALAMILYVATTFSAAHAGANGLVRYVKAPGVCGGKDLLADLKTTSPKAYSQILTEAEQIKNGDAILWKVEKDGVEPSYLFGTVHLTDARANEFSDQVLGALARSETLALEVADLSPENTSKAIAEAARSVLFTDGTRLDKILPKEDYAFAAKIMKNSGMPTGLAPLFKPWIVTMILSVPECERRKVSKGQLVVDMRLAEEARKIGVKVVGLETISSQLKAMAAVPLRDQVEILRASLKYVDQTQDLSETILQLYLKRRISAVLPFQAALAQRVGVNPNVYDSFKQEILEKRNLTMRDKALPLVNQGKAFIGVGALHLPGDSGLVALLRKDGFKVTAIE